MTDQPVRNTEISLTLNPDAPKVPQLIDGIIILAVEAQNSYLEQFEGFDRWDADLAAQTFTLSRADRNLVFTPYFVGSSSGQSDTWMWGWNNINGFPDGVVEIADEVYNFGEHFDEPLLTVAQQPLGEAERTAEGLPDADYGFGVERTFVHVAQALSGIAAPLYYRAPTGNGSFVWFLLSNPAEFALPPATVLKTLSALTESLQSGYVHDAVAALTGYADKREGVTLELGEGAAVLHTTDGDVNVELDEQGRIARIFGTAGGGTTHVVTPQDAPAPQAPPAARAAGVRSAGEEGLLRQAVRSLTEPVVQIASAGRRPRRLNATKHPRAAATQMTPDMPSATGAP